MENVIFSLTADHCCQSVHYTTEIENVETWTEFLGSAVFPALRAHTYILPNDEDLIGALEDVIEGNTNEEIADLNEEIVDALVLKEAILKACYKDKWPDGGKTYENYKNDILDSVCDLEEE